MAPPYFDLSGVLQVQKDYLSKRSDQPPSEEIDAINTKLDDLYKTYGAANISTDRVLTNQDLVSDIVTKEKARLDAKKQGVDDAIFGQKRAIELNNSNLLKQRSYTNLLIIFIITVSAFVAIMLISKKLPFVPQFIFDILLIIVISIGIYIGMSLYLDIQTRNNMNFNELNLPGLNNNLAGNTVAAGAGKGSLSNLISGSYGCVGNECCGEGTSWNQETSMCNPTTTTTGTRTTSVTGTFATMEIAYNDGDILSKTNGIISSNAPYEFDKYSAVN